MAKAIKMTMGLIKLRAIKKYMVHHKKTADHRLLYIRTGFLKDNIFLSPILYTGNSLIGKITAKADYSGINEYGGTAVSRKGKRYQVKARPFLRPALIDEQDKIINYFYNFYNRG